MAFVSQHNITNNASTELFTSLDNPGEIISIVIANTHDSSGTICDVFSNDSVNTFYIIKNVIIPQGSSLVLTNEVFDIKTDQGLYIKLIGQNGSTSAATVIIKT